MSSHPNEELSSIKSDPLSRRDFLKTMGMVVAGGLLAGCAPKLATLSAPSVTAVTSGTPVLYRPVVALAQAQTYDRKLIRQQMQALFDGLGGVKDILDSGDKAVLKVNLTGGTQYKPKDGEKPTEYHITHPEVVRAVGELLLDAGAKSLYIVESLSDAHSVSEYGYTEIIHSLNATLIDLNQATPYSDFAIVPVEPDHYIYEKLLLNPILKEADCFVSIAKMKPHCSAGVTLSMKNLVGIGPLRYYRRSAGDGNRTSFHGTETGKNTRLPRVIVDLNRARPINLAVIDGVSTIEGGEGPWTIYTKQVKPGVLLAGKNALATDSVAASVMGFDPTSEAPDAPFLQSDNYLNLACAQGLGTNHLNAIDTVGVDPAEVHYPFAACTEW